MPYLGMTELNGVDGRSERIRVKSTRRAKKRISSGHTQAPLAEALDQLLRERDLTISALARRLGVSQPFLSRAIRGAAQKRASPELLEAIAGQLEVEPNYFIEYRRFQIQAAIGRSAELTDDVYRVIERADKVR